MIIRILTATLAFLTTAASVVRGADIWVEANEHPRLFITPERIGVIKGQIRINGSHHQLAYDAMKARVDSKSESAYREHVEAYKNGYIAREAAFLALLAGSPTEQRKYADLAFEKIKHIYAASSDRTPVKGSGLARAMMSISVGIPFDWLYNIWTDEQRAFVQEKVTAALDAWPSFGHPNLGDTKGSNWTGVCRGGELILLLCAGEEKARAGRYGKLKRDLRTHVNNGYGDLGVSQEGLGYSEYPGGFTLPAAYACADIGDDELVGAMKPWWKLAMYSHGFMPHERKFIQHGVAHSSNYDEGWASLLLNLAPAEHLPYFVWWYDRHMGRLGPGEPEKLFDADRAGTVWALIYYPESVAAKDPTGVYPAGVGDNHGYYFFRNRWKDEDDILTSIMADTHQHGHAWDMPDELEINLMAYNTRFIGGSAKSKGDALHSTLLVDGMYSSAGGAKSSTGRTIAFEPGRDGGYAIVGNGPLYKALGVNDALRHMLVKFVSPRNEAIISTLDRVKSAKEHEYTWQANLGDETGDDDVVCEDGTESGRVTFTLRGRNDGFVKGWVLHPEQVEIKTGDPLKITAKGADQDIWVVMFVGSGRMAPKARITGDGLSSRITVGGKTVSYSSATDRISLR